jgi:hypothetical protein
LGVAVVVVTGQLFNGTVKALVATDDYLVAGDNYVHESRVLKVAGINGAWGLENHIVVVVGYRAGKLERYRTCEINRPGIGNQLAGICPIGFYLDNGTSAEVCAVNGKNA